MHALRAGRGRGRRPRAVSAAPKRNVRAEPEAAAGLIPDFTYATCQVGAEAALKGEIARRWPGFRLAFSRPGFLTFKLPERHGLADDFDLQCAFARAYGFSLGGVTGQGPVELAEKAWELGGSRPIRRIHVWERDHREPGDHGYEPGITAAALDARRLLIERRPRGVNLASDADDARQAARAGEFVLDCILYDAGRWWIGYHRAGAIPSRYPGGMMPLELPPDAVSRAWLKMEEALRWSGLPMVSGGRVAEIGSAPGGASQALLARGLLVTGIDPAAMAPEVLRHPNFSHIRRRSTQVRRREFRKIRWLTADMNVAPRYTLDAVEAIVTHEEVHIRGMILTLKLTDWALADRVPEYLERVRSWGYHVVRARQLQHNRREICVAALRKPFGRK
jgi:23S rRNA (cytidine2498-2'-O)-methyltransferase